MCKNKRIIVALDSDNLDKTIKLVESIKNYIFGVKIGYEFFFNFGLDGYKEIQRRKINIFLDLKLHDIPNTVKNGIISIASLKPYFTTVHISGGEEMLKVSNANKNNTKILGVSALTSLNNEQVKKIYFRKNVTELVTDFANFAIKNKLDGIICSPHEIQTVKKIARKKL